MSSLKDLKERLLTDPATKAEYEAQASEFEIGEELIRARQRAALRMATDNRKTRRAELRALPID